MSRSFSFSLGQPALPRKPSLIITTPNPVANQTTAPKPVWLQTTPRPPVHLPVTLPSVTNTHAGVTIPSDVTSKTSPVAGLVQLPNAITNKLLSLAPPVLSPNATPAESPRITTNKPSAILPVTPSLSSFNVTLGAADEIKGVFQQISSSVKRPEKKLVARKY